MLKAKAAKWREQNREHLRAKSAARRQAKRAMCLVAAARVRARRRGTPFSLTDAGVCEISGVGLTLSGPRSATSPSLDRIVPELGYTSGNVRIVCHALNAGMGDWGEGELLRIVKAWTATPSCRK